MRLLPGPNTGGCRRSPLDTLRSPLNDVPDENDDGNANRYGDDSDGGKVTRIGQVWMPGGNVLFKLRLPAERFSTGGTSP